ncbi:hypothetical protein FPCIR_12212 [Fusarium pseudocircinatum]|uniref:Uncharacterized protein n=1 Tax=Fusarium pseudocircinatum TaxID=56676 RepID=A0A8H5NT36_9HYPO|nr:hypothetical protein FPCIR_12212 [Fusarium pseudocircinatum]
MVEGAIHKHPELYAARRRAVDQIERAIDVLIPMLRRENTVEDLWQGGSLARTVSLQLQLDESIAKECEAWLAAGRDILVFIYGRMEEQVAQPFIYIYLQSIIEIAMQYRHGRAHRS